MSSTSRRRAGAASGLLFVVLIMVGNGIATGNETADISSSGAAVLADLRANGGAAWQIGVSLEMLGFVALVAFSAYLASALRRAEGEDGWLGGAALASGLLLAAIKLASAAPVLEATWRARHGLDPETARALVGIGDFAFTVSWLPAAMLVGFTALGALRTGLLPRGMAIAGLAVAVAGLATMPAAIVAEGPGVVPFLLGLLWIAAASVVLTRRASERAPVVRAAAVAA
jgi:hypothetical protein